MGASGMRRGGAIASRRETLEFYLFISPWLIGLIVFLVYPLASSLYYSFTRYEIGGRPFWIGLENYARMFADPLYLKTIQTTFTFALISVPGMSIVALGLALILAQQLRGINAFRTIYFMPSVMPMVAISLTWFYVLRPETGPLAGFLALFGIQTPRFLGEVRWALPALALINIWLNFGGQMVIYLAGIKGIPQELYEVAQIDGAGQWGKLRHVTLPMLSSTIFLNLVLGIIGAMQMFDIPYVMTRGGPSDSTRTYMLHLYNRGWVEIQMGSASAMGWILFLIIMAITLLVVRSSQAWVYYEGERR
ncbi:MAG: Sugar transporter permease [Chloroflexota bacterium]|nr:Sugar transporter permease [Chloroflexota bacterium]